MGLALRLLSGLGLAVCHIAPCPTHAAPPYYRRAGTWQESMRLSREALQQREKAETAGRESLQQPTGMLVSSQGTPARFQCAVAGLGTVYLSAVPDRRDGKAQTFFYRPAWILKDGTRAPVTGAQCKARYGTRRLAMAGHKRWQTLKASGETFNTGFALQGRCEAQLTPPPGAAALEAWVCVPKGTKGKQARVAGSAWPVVGTAEEAAAKREGLWTPVCADFPDALSGTQIRWERRDGIWKGDWPEGEVARLARRYASHCAGAARDQALELVETAATPDDLARVRALYYASAACKDALPQIARIDLTAVELAIKDTATTFPDRYTDGPRHLGELDEWAAALEQLKADLESGDANALPHAEAFLAWRRRVMLANPLLDLDRLLVLKRELGAHARSAMSSQLGMPRLNSHTLESVRRRGWDNEIAQLSDLRGSAKLDTLHRPEGEAILSEMDVHFNGDRIMFSSIGSHERWHLFEMNSDGANVRQLTPDDVEDIDFFDSCYLPDGRIVTTSTAPFAALPCENGSRYMACLYLLEPDTGRLRQLTFEQDSDWCPTVLNNGRLLYLRWEYTDTAHYFTRILFHCNPDGTDQKEYYGSNSYFPNAFFFARPIPGHSTQVIGVAGGHHGISRSGRLLLLDPARGRHEADGVVQEIPGRGKPVEPIIKDRLVDGVWPQFLHPYPLAEADTDRGAGKYFLVSMKRAPDALWGIYLVDVFDNITLVKEVEGAALLEPIPLRPTRIPPVVPDQVQLNRKDAVVFLTDVHRGPGLRGVPYGTVKRLRLFAYHYCYRKTGGHRSVGVESSWDIKRILGTVPVEPDGSACFRIPANTPISIQPLDDKGRALQLMRSWMVGMPGEVVSCIGCHVPQNEVPPGAAPPTAVRREPSEITPWHGPARPFAFRFEIQPVLNRHCLSCHNGGGGLSAGRPIPDFRPAPGRVPYSKDKAYMALQAYVRRPGPEGDYHMLRPMEYHASSSELVQLLEKGHNGVQLTPEDWERLTTWIDLNAPYRGKWAPADDQDRRRLELAKRYANVTVDPEREYDTLETNAATQAPAAPVSPSLTAAYPSHTPSPAGWPLTAQQAAELQWRAFQPAAASTVQATPEPEPIVDAGPWHTLGPLSQEGKDAFEFVFEPEKRVDLKRDVRGKRWKLQQDWTDGRVLSLSAPGNAATYCYRSLTADTARTVPAFLGSDDGIVVWLNGNKIHANNVPRGAAPDQDRVELPLQEGRNELLLKIVNLRGAHAFYFSLSPASRSRTRQPNPCERVIDLGGDVALRLTFVPAGTFVMGSQYGPEDEQPPCEVRIAKPFWLGATEISNAQYARFDPSHDSAYFDRMGKDHSVRGVPANRPDQPVIRVTWQQAMGFCRWLAQRTGERVTLPTEAQWEWACRAGAYTPFWYGDTGADFATTANLADAGAARTGPNLPAAHSVRDFGTYTAAVGNGKPNVWGLFDMHGNVAEWTRSDSATYPYRADDGRNGLDLTKRKSVRGGSWRDRPHRATASFRTAYETFQPVANVGFRIAIESGQ